MFTGIIEEIGKIKGISKGVRSVSLEIEAEVILEDTRIGDSISTNGVCLTVTDMGTRSFRADVMPETMRKSSLGGLKSGDPVNLERALTLSSRLGGHMVSGHIDGTGRIVAFEKDDTAIWITVSAAPELLRYIINKGSVALDGVSLTVAYIDRSVFKVSVIPHTQQATTLTGKRVGDVINIENDMVARYIEKLAGREKGDGISLEFLQSNGF